MRLLLLIACMVATVGAKAADTLFVNVNAPTGGNGQSWEGAYQVLSVALESSNEGDEIWIARGVYTPDKNGGIVPGGRESVFRVANGRKLYGGFQGHETYREFRDWYRFPTILSADVQQNDAGMAEADNTTMKDDNTYGLMRINDPAVNIDSTTIIDGLIFERAFGLGALEIYGVPVFRNCTFRYNYASETAAVLTMPSARVRMEYCVFQENRSDLASVLVFTQAPEGDVMPGPYIAQCVFIRNHGGGDGACISMGSGARGVVYSSIFYENLSDRTAGAIFCASGTKTYITMSTFARNVGITATDSGSTVAAYTAEIVNSIFWDDREDGTRAIAWAGAGNIATDTMSVKACAIRNDFVWGEYPFDPQYIDINNPTGPDGFWNTDDDGLRPAPDLNMKDKGVLSPFTNHARTDAVGNARVVGRGVDLGAYEQQRPGHDSYREHMQLLREGKLVVAARHFNTDWSEKDPGPSAECFPGRNLSTDGRDQARSISSYRQALNVPFGDVFSSPVCRCWEGAQLAFGRFVIKQHWGSGGAISPDRVADLKTIPEGGNRFISTHDAVLFVIFGSNGSQDMLSGEVCEGDELLVRPDGDNYDVISHWTVDNWERYRVRFPDATVSVEEGAVEGASTFSVAPNPVAGQLTVSVEKPSQIIVCDATGVVVFTGNVSTKHTVDMSAFAQGVYYVRHVNSGTSRTVVVMH